MAGNQIPLGLPHPLVGSSGFQTAPQREKAYSAASRFRPLRASLRKQSESHSPTSMDDQRIALLEAENAALRARLESLGTDPDNVIVLDDERVLQDVGIYRYHHPLENALAYQERLDDIAARIADLIKAGTAIEKSNMFTFDGSLAKGRAMTNDLARLMLRAYNAEAENVVRSFRAGNTVTAIKRLDAARTAIAKLGKMMEMHIGDEFHALRIEEIELTADYLMKKEEEREAARAERERLREERKVELELAAARERLEKERSHILTVIEKVRANGSSDPELERKLADIDSAIALERLPCRQHSRGLRLCHLEPRGIRPTRRENWSNPPPGAPRAYL